MRTIKAILREYNRKYKPNYEETLSRNNMGFVIVNTNTQDVDNEKEDIDIRNLDIDLDFIDIKLLVNEYKLDIIDKYLEEHINKEIVDNDLIDYNNWVDYKNFVVKKLYGILKQKIEEERNMFIRERKRRFNLLNNRNKIRRLFRDKKLERYMNKSVESKYNETDEYGKTKLENEIYNKNRLYEAKKDEDIILDSMYSMLNKLFQQVAEIHNRYDANYLLIYRQLDTFIFDKQEMEKELLQFMGKEKDFYQMREFYEVERKLFEYEKFIVQKSENENVKRKFELLESEYIDTLNFCTEIHKKNISNDFFRI